jgi:hypothetical protein
MWKSYNDIQRGEDTEMILILAKGNMDKYFIIYYYLFKLQMGIYPVAVVLQ